MLAHFHIFKDSSSQKTYPQALSEHIQTIVAEQKNVYVFSDASRISELSRMLYTTHQQSFLAHELEDSADCKETSIVIGSGAIKNIERYQSLAICIFPNNLFSEPPSAKWQSIHIFSHTSDSEKELCRKYAAFFKSRDSKIKSFEY